MWESFVEEFKTYGNLIFKKFKNTEFILKVF